MCQVSLVVKYRSDKTDELRLQIVFQATATS